MTSRLVISFEDLQRSCAVGQVKPDVWSSLGAKSVSKMKRAGAPIGFWTRKRDVLAFSLRGPEEFRVAWEAGVDFWTTVPNDSE